MQHVHNENRQRALNGIHATRGSDGQHQNSVVTIYNSDAGVLKLLVVYVQCRDYKYICFRHNRVAAFDAHMHHYMPCTWTYPTTYIVLITQVHLTIFQQVHMTKLSQGVTGAV